MLIYTEGKGLEEQERNDDMLSEKEEEQREREKRG